MGRHSAPDDDDDADDSAAASSAVLTEEDTAAGRHSHRQDPQVSGDRDARPSPPRPTAPQPSDASSTQQIPRPQPGGEASTGPIRSFEPPAAYDELLDLDAPVDLPETDLDLLPGGFETVSEDGRQKPAKKPKRPRPGSGDLTLLRRHSDVRARVVAAVVVPFVVYFAVQVAIGSTGRQMLLFIFIPLILAGVLVGTFLDIGDKKYRPPPAYPDGSVAVLPSAEAAGDQSTEAVRVQQQLPQHWHQNVAWPERDQSDVGDSTSGKPERDQ